MDKSKYFINVGNGEISQAKHDNNDYLTIYASDSEIGYLRRKFENMHKASFGSFIRSHIPLVEYHNDTANDQYDENMLEVYRMLHELGDETTKSHIESMEIL
ncbi:hydrolase [Oceanobacillus halophilus]|uniref:Hydrolase n=1 Tax=Oceanobacillus halophilus TaxID=930130 RepID=A0A494ZTP2_9BACI|nr:hydrolase [Oceanobacillus halophilus]RKQ29567.1 hydrolase [Oceanobacillus halophilus]